MHGGQDWKLLGPFTAYRALGAKPPIKTEHHMFSTFDDKEIYTMIDPFEINCTNFTSPQDIELETHRVIDKVFGRQDDHDAAIEIKHENQKHLEQELVQLARLGPSYYRQQFT
ncbi:hypothetical protein BdWA1_002005 [Babesia duncani]|uniref:Uncharacterized protein n=1 Tax=Babesia duncani TaxID=323732 RepID=A0AAD9PKW4_9APIC|nr:hypothetical protein BdWA1_002005 [Babesia duncani]